MILQIKTETEDWVYPGLSFIAEFGGAMGLFVGFSFYMIWDCLVYLSSKWVQKKKNGVDENTHESNKVP